MKILRTGRSGSTGRPAQTRRADHDLSSKVRTEATVDACRSDYATGAAERKAFDARAQRSDG